tara:strand:- start:7029 stop:7739 length:711 start_codon:yes stop_codon:yes gene_type:complete
MKWQQSGRENMMPKSTPLFGLIYVLSAVLFLIGVSFDMWLLRFITKPIPVLLLMIWIGLYIDKRRYVMCILLGLGASLAGDVFLELPGNYFLFGLVSFLIAHILYIVAYLQDAKDLHLLRALPAGVYGVIFVSVLVSGGQLGPLLIPVVIYATVLCAMLWRAGSRYGAASVSTFSAHMAFWGAVFFVMSDSLLGLNRFYTQDIPFVRFGISSLYWLGQAGITFSVLSSLHPQQKSS